MTKKGGEEPESETTRKEGEKDGGGDEGGGGDGAVFTAYKDQVKQFQPGLPPRGSWGGKIGPHGG